MPICGAARPCLDASRVYVLREAHDQHHREVAAEDRRGRVLQVAAELERHARDRRHDSGSVAAYHRHGGK